MKGPPAVTTIQVKRRMWHSSGTPRTPNLPASSKNPGKLKLIHLEASQCMSMLSMFLVPSTAPRFGCWDGPVIGSHCFVGSGGLIYAWVRIASHSSAPSPSKDRQPKSHAQAKHQEAKRKPKKSGCIELRLAIASTPLRPRSKNQTLGHSQSCKMNNSP